MRRASGCAEASVSPRLAPQEGATDTPPARVGRAAHDDRVPEYGNGLNGLHRRADASDGGGCLADPSPESQPPLREQNAEEHHHRTQGLVPRQPFAEDRHAERDPHDRLLFETLRLLDEPVDGAALARFELLLLEELGFGLDLETCAVTGATEGLTHVSPKTGRAVSREAAEPYKDRLLRLPTFLRARGNASPSDIADAFALTGHFLEMHVWRARGIEPPAIRNDLVEMLAK